jgi:hypothetical protein
MIGFAAELCLGVLKIYIPSNLMPLFLGTGKTKKHNNFMYGQSMIAKL